MQTGLDGVVCRVFVVTVDVVAELIASFQCSLIPDWEKRALETCSPKTLAQFGKIPAMWKIWSQKLSLQAKTCDHICVTRLFCGSFVLADCSRQSWCVLCETTAAKHVLWTSPTKGQGQNTLVNLYLFSELAHYYFCKPRVMTVISTCFLSSPFIYLTPLSSSLFPPLTP